MANSVFLNPDIKIHRSLFKGLSHRHQTTMKHGELVPLAVIPVVPGDSMKISMNKFVRMATPIAPIMDNIYMNVDAFFVPHRLTWKEFKKFCGENDTQKGAANTDNSMSIPATTSYPYRNKNCIGTMGDYLGVVQDELSGQAAPVSVLPMRAIALIWNRWYRPENIVDPMIVANDFSSTIATRNGIAWDYTKKPLPVYKMHDLYTSCVDSPQAGDPVTISLLGEAPLIRVQDQPFVAASTMYDIKHGNTNGIKLGSSSGDTTNSIAQLNQVGILNSGEEITPGTNGYVIDKANIALNTDAYKTDLSNVAALNINDLRFANQLQRFKEREIMSGSRYWEFLKAHFSVIAPDASLQDPEYLGSNQMKINIAPIYQTTGAKNDQTSELGMPGATSATRQDDFLFAKSFVEYGYVVILADFKHTRTYGQGFERHYTSLKFTEQYLPEFACRGYEKRRRDELYVTSNTEQNKSPFGFNEPDAEYRNMRNRVSGLLNPANPESLNFWNLAENFSSQPILNEEFMIEDAKEIERCLTTGGLGPHYLVDTYFDITAIRPLPTFAIPSLKGWY